MIRRYDGQDLARVLAYYGLLETTEHSQFKIVCPFHDDVNPSMIIDLSEGSFYCFGCGLKGNAYDFVRLANPELTDLQCVIVLEKIQRTKQTSDVTLKRMKKKRTDTGRALEEAEDYYYGLRRTDWENPENEQQKQIVAYMESRGFQARDLVFADCRENYSIAYPFIFPILDNGRFCGWVGRTMDSRVAQIRKYLYNEGFYKRNTLCGVYHKNSVVYLCEGYMDYLSLRTRGKLNNVCAVLGWHISDMQVEKLKEKGVTTVVSALDNDKSGEKGTELLRKYFEVIRFPFPEGRKDPGEMTREEIRRAIRRVEREVKHETAYQGKSESSVLSERNTKRAGNQSHGRQYRRGWNGGTRNTEKVPGKRENGVRGKHGTERV